MNRFAALMAAACGAAEDSRAIRPGDLFLAYPVGDGDGRKHIGDAIARGASAVLWEAEGDFRWRDEWQVPNAPVSGLKALSGDIAQAVYGHPSERLSLIAVTGTNGKTTISQWLAQALTENGIPTAAIGTLGAGLWGQMPQATGFTTPPAAALARLLRDFADQGAKAAALEASSIGLEEGRLASSRIDTAIFTNFTRDHLDYHGTMAAYANAKKKLFLWPKLRFAVINLDDPFGSRLACECTASRLVGTSIAQTPPPFAALVRASDIEEKPGIACTLHTPKGKVAIQTRLIGRHNLSNLLAVAAVLEDRGLDLPTIARTLSGLLPPAGRLERIGHDEAQPLCVVDYAHTPDALENALTALRPVARQRGGRLICLFGCGGGRDKGKRPQMGKIAAACADLVLLTSDNPRGEDPAAIIADIQGGIAGAAAPSFIDRAAAIKAAIAQAQPEDVLLVAGKGHETTQEIAGVKRPFSDAEAIRAALTQRGTTCIGT
ncbi:MAG: UDP-N-acetylmuramoyl-L-alanyl-D-glutamate--2,6-diaminopimelate ligase [Zoogloeaceae bacterium]|jgi:UDP-N-acetylmuramoyl-L-alanyl-D-glutamate--2,6-diaminopimelate ligase|nr:UDP-N-acetylmuramoyl-L-alanyl-D-glutamate--2,6-diaminopimelate ligase [Zoogloeaceae bacterium]